MMLERERALALPLGAQKQPSGERSLTTAFSQLPSPAPHVCVCLEIRLHSEYIVTQVSTLPYQTYIPVRITEF